MTNKYGNNYHNPLNFIKSALLLIAVFSHGVLSANEPEAINNLLKDQIAFGCKVLTHLAAQNAHENIVVAPAALSDLLLAGYSTGDPKLMQLTENLFSDPNLRNFSGQFRILHDRLTNTPNLSFVMGVFQQNKAVSNLFDGWKNIKFQKLSTDKNQAANDINQWSGTNLVDPRQWPVTPPVALTAKVKLDTKWAQPMQQEQPGTFYDSQNKPYTTNFTHGNWTDIGYIKVRDPKESDWYYAFWLPNAGEKEIKQEKKSLWARVTGLFSSPKSTPISRLQTLVVLPPKTVDMKEAITRLRELLSTPKGWQGTNINFELPNAEVNTSSQMLQNALIASTGLSSDKISPQIKAAVSAIIANTSFTFQRSGTTGELKASVTTKPEIGAPLVVDTAFYPHITIKFDRPFLFAVVDAENNTVLFMGIVQKPKPLTKY